MNKNPHDAFIDALPDDAYGMCPCGCGKKLKFVAQEKPQDVEQHFQRFVQQLPKGEYPDALTKFDALIAEASEVKE